MHDSDSDSDSNHQNMFRKIYARQLEKKQMVQNSKNDKEREQKTGNNNSVKEENKGNQNNIEQPVIERRRRSRSRSRSRDKILDTPLQIRWHIYERCPMLALQSRVAKTILELPIYKKKQEIMAAITKNQFVLVTGETGCGKSTQVPRLIYEYMRNLGDNSSKIMCVQPRRLAVMNLHSILEDQMMEKGQIGYQIGMKSHIQPTNRIVFVTNGIFLQRLVHSTQFFNQFPFIILDQVHERDIDTDFILLTIKRVIRKYPKVRVVLMSATIDNELFRFYFASDHIDNILKDQNFYKRIIAAKKNNIKKQHYRSEPEQNQNDNESISGGIAQIQLDSQNDEQELYKTYGLQFMKSKYPCPAINVTEPGKYTREYYYLDTIHQFLPPNTLNVRWGGVIFSDKYPNTHKELYETVCLIIDQIVKIHYKNTIKASVLIFMPGLAQIQNLSQSIYSFFKTERVNREFDIIHVHSSILNDEITRKLHENPGSKFKIIISTNIAESSITVKGVKYVIDFCLSKEIKFDLKSRMENLELVWASKASCNQRAGRTGRVCDGVIIRMLQKKFYQNLADYSTPEIQRSSLDKLILRIKLLHEGEKNQIFSDPGEVLGSAIQPPNLKNIDTAIKSLQFCGGLQFRDESFILTNLGRLYIDIPIDITYCKLLVMSHLFDTYNDMVILVSILSQSKNAIRRGNIQKNYMKYYQMMQNTESCDFLALIKLYKDTQKLRQQNGYRSNNNYRPNNNKYGYDQTLSLQIYNEVNQMIYDINKRMKKKKLQFFQKEQRENVVKKFYKIYSKNMMTDNENDDEIKNKEKLFRFKMTIMSGFIQNILKVREPMYDDRQEKRLKFMKKFDIKNRNTVCLLGSTVIKKPQNIQAEQRLKYTWANHLERSTKIPNIDFTITHGMSYLHFKNQQDLNKFLFIRYVEESKRSISNDINGEGAAGKNYLSIPEILRCFGEMDHMQQGRPVTFSREQSVSIDNYSLNRIVNVNEGDNPKLLIANNIAKQSSRMVARYTSLLPSDIKYLDAIGHLLFYPFVTLITNKKKNRYQFIQLKKKHRIPINFNLNDNQIAKANIIRQKIREFLQLNEQNLSKFVDFQQLVLDYVYMQRQQVLQEERWLQIYLDQLFETNPQLKQSYNSLLNRISESYTMMDQQTNSKHTDKLFMNDIKPVKLTQNFFCDDVIGTTTLQWRRANYRDWKINKLKIIKAIQDKALDHDSYLACGQNSCGLKLCKLKKVGPITKQIYRDLFQVQADNVKQLQFNQTDDHFCTLLLGNYSDFTYKTYGCANNHYFGIMIDGERKIKILPFSQLLIIYPDGSAEKAQFQKLEMRIWKKKNDERLKLKCSTKISTFCFICDQVLTTFKDLQYHIKESKHNNYVKQFKKSLQHIKVVKVNQEDVEAAEDEGY